MNFEFFTVVADAGPVTWTGAVRSGRVHSFEDYLHAKTYRRKLLAQNPTQKFFIVHTVVENGNVYSEIKSHAEEDL